MCVSLKVASQLCHATSGPVKAMEGSLHQWRHDAAHVHLIAAAVPLTIVLHPKPAERERGRGSEEKRDEPVRQIGNMWEETQNKGTGVKQQFFHEILAEVTSGPKL